MKKIKKKQQQQMWLPRGFATPKSAAKPAEAAIKNLFSLIFISLITQKEEPKLEKMRNVSRKKFSDVNSNEVQHQVQAAQNQQSKTGEKL